MGWRQTEQNQKDQETFAEKLAELLFNDNAEKGNALAVLIEERIEELAQQKANNALDREFNRGDYRY